MLETLKIRERFNADSNSGHSLLLTEGSFLKGSYESPDLVKRAMDLVLSVLVGMTFLPVIIFCWIALRFSGGPIVFSQPRVGRNGKIFRVFKFRTMVENADVVLQQLMDADPAIKAEYLRDHKLRNDPRVTPVGRFLRRTSLDELPQLLNVLRGDMSFVGPRPVESFEMKKYGRFARYYVAQKPGITGIWQVSGRNDVNFARRVAMDAYYSKRRNAMMDLVIVVKTVRVVLRGSGAY